MNAPRLASFLAGAVAVGLLANFFAGPPPNFTDLSRRIEAVQKGIRTENDAFADGFLAACGDPCWINSNPGGVIGNYEALARLVLATNRRVIINGDCASACTVFADKARPMVQITITSRFQFHRSQTEHDLPLSPDVADWVNAHGGFPSNASGDLTTMVFADAKAFWPEIGSHDHPLRFSDFRGSLP